MDYELSAYMNGTQDLLTGSYYTKSYLNENYMTFKDFVAQALLAGALISVSSGYILIRTVAGFIQVANERKNSQSRDNIGELGVYTGTYPEFIVVLTTLANEASDIPEVVMDNVFPTPAQPDWGNYIYGEYVFPRRVVMTFRKYPRGLQGRTEERRRDPNNNNPDAPPVAPVPPPIPLPTPPMPPIPPQLPPPPPRFPPPQPRPKRPLDPIRNDKQADLYQKSNLYQRKFKNGDITGRKQVSSSDISILI